MNSAELGQTRIRRWAPHHEGGDWGYRPRFVAAFFFAVFLLAVFPLTVVAFFATGFFAGP